MNQQIHNSRVLKKSVLWILDRILIPVAIGGAFIRIGNFFNSEIIGKAAAEGLPWAIVFKAVDNVPRHPGQLYEAFGYVFVFLIV